MSWVRRLLHFFFGNGNMRIPAASGITRYTWVYHIYISQCQHFFIPKSWDLDAAIYPIGLRMIPAEDFPKFSQNVALQSVSKNRQQTWILCTRRFISEKQKDRASLMRNSESDGPWFSCLLGGVFSWGMKVEVWRFREFRRYEKIVLKRR